MTRRVATEPPEDDIDADTDIDPDDDGLRVPRRGSWLRPAPPTRLGRILLWGIPVVVVVIVLLAVAYFTPLLSVRSVRVEGLSAVPEQDVRAVLRIPDGRSMLRIDTDAIARRVAALPKVRSARVQREYPSTVRVTVDERRAVLFFDSPQGTHLVDTEGVEFAIEPAPPGVPKLTTAHPGGADPLTRAAVTVLDAAPPALRAQVGEVAARSVSDIELHLRDGRTVVWGGADDSERKAAVVLPVLTREGTVFDVSSPDLVTVR
ncbi:cell division protein FtsQ/DivIB [Nocardia nova]|uniref:cell division protein FtsQ/DivIB n=1 Tax=Nocardia nova TaxID=37330 RepID=UPI0033E0DC26